MCSGPNLSHLVTVLSINFVSSDTRHSSDLVQHKHKKIIFSTTKFKAVKALGKCLVETFLDNENCIRSIKNDNYLYILPQEISS